jgi:hypothetical protein
MTGKPTPRTVQYLFVHGQNEDSTTRPPARARNVERAGYARRIRDDGWTIKQRLVGAVRSTLDRR